MSQKRKVKRRRRKRKSQSFCADKACMFVCVSVYVCLCMCLFVCDYYRYVHLYGDQCDWPVIEPGKRARWAASGCWRTCWWNFLCLTWDAA